jgi:hypothetical protein
MGDESTLASADTSPGQHEMAMLAKRSDLERKYNNQRSSSVQEVRQAYELTSRDLNPLRAFKPSTGITLGVALLFLGAAFLGIHRSHRPHFWTSTIVVPQLFLFAFFALLSVASYCDLWKKQLIALKRFTSLHEHTDEDHSQSEPVDG